MKKFLIILMASAAVVFMAGCTQETQNKFGRGLQNWTEGLAEAFHAAMGYDPVTYMPLLTEGWSVAAVLPSGKIVVSNDYTLRFFFCEKCAFALEKKLGLKLSAKIHKMGRLMLCYVTRHTPSETVKIR